MALLTLVRHGQASFLADDYDQLSSIGIAQSQALGRWWTGSHLHFDLVLCGPAKRHWATYEQVAKQFREANWFLPEAVEIPEWNEYQGFEMIYAFLPERLKEDSVLRDLHDQYQHLGKTEDGFRIFEKMFMRLARAWVNEAWEHPEVESWLAFRARFEQGMDRIRKLVQAKESVLVFTSGGPIAAAMGTALALNDEKTLELSWSSRNGGYSQFSLTGDGLGLITFNTHPHLTEHHLLTYR